MALADTVGGAAGDVEDHAGGLGAARHISWSHRQFGLGVAGSDEWSVQKILNTEGVLCERDPVCISRLPPDILQYGGGMERCDRFRKQDLFLRDCC